MLDMDGVLWRGDRSIDGAADAVRALIERGEQVVCCTNHALSAEHKQATLERLGFPALPVVTAADAACSSCGSGDRVLVLGDASLVEVLRSGGVDTLDLSSLPDGARVPEVDVVVVGACSTWDRSRIGMAADAVRAGARLLATNDDTTFPTSGPDGPRLLPGNGALVAALSAAAGRSADVAGKPHAPMADELLRRWGSIEVVVGDRPDTDGRLAARIGARFALVLSGVTAAAPDPAEGEPEPWAVCTDLAELVQRWSSGELTHQGSAARR